MKARTCTALVLLACLAGVGPGQERPLEAGPPGKGVPTPEDKAPARAEQLKAPDGGVVVIVGDYKEAQKLVPEMVILSPAAYQKLLQRVEELEKQLKPVRTLPSGCRLKGKVEGDFLTLTAAFTVATDEANRLVQLGLQGCYLVEADMDGALPDLRGGPRDGYAVQVPRPGKYQLTLACKAPVTSTTSRSGPPTVERGFAFGLPGAAVLPALQLELPPAVKEVRWNQFVEKRGPQQAADLWSIPVTSDAETLKVAWKEPGQPLNQGAALTGHWDVTVQLQEKEVRTTARLTVTDPGGKLAAWQLLLPDGVKAEDVVVSGEGTGYEVRQEKKTGLWEVKGPPAQLLTVEARLTQPRPFTRLPVGPFLLVGADQQPADLRVEAAPETKRGQRLGITALPDLRPENLPRDRPRELHALYKAWNLYPSAQPARLAPAKGRPKLPPLLEIEIRPQPPQVETSVEHELRLLPAAGGWQLSLKTTVLAVPGANGADFLDLQLPARPPAEAEAAARAVAAGLFPFPVTLTGLAGWLAGAYDSPVRPPRGYVCSGDLELLPGQNKARVHFGQLQLEPFKVELFGLYSVAGDPTQVWLPLPRPQSLIDAGARLTVIVPRDLELLPPEDKTANSSEVREGRELRWVRSPRDVTLGWRASPPDLPVAVVADVALRGRHANVRQTLRFPLAAGDGTAPPARTVRLRVPEGLAGSPRVDPGGQVVSFNESARLLVVETDPQGKVGLEYEFPLPASPADSPATPLTFAVPLVEAEQATRAGTTLRVWGEPGLAPAVAPGVPGNERWLDQAVQPVPGKKDLPAVAVRSETAGVPLTLQSVPVPRSALARVRADRTLVQVVVDEAGTLFVRARFLLTALDADRLDVLLPAGAEDLHGLEVDLRRQADLGKAVPRVPFDLVGEAGGTRLRLRNLDAELFTAPAVLDVRYRLTPGGPEDVRLWQARFTPPVLGGEAFTGQVRWDVRVPGGQLPVLLDGHGQPPPRWRWQSWLLTPGAPLSGADLEAWVTGGAAAGPAEPAGLLFWDSDLGPVRALLVPRPVWLFLCSTLFLAAGLGFTALSPRGPGWWALLAATGAVVAGVALWLPGALPLVVYGVQPGAAVLLALLAVQWLLHQRYRRQVIFMPSFTRVRPGSSPGRGSSVLREPSTVDAAALPVRPSSSVSRAAQAPQP